MKFSQRHQSTGIAYPYVAQVSKLMLRAFFRKIYLYNTKVVPMNKPVLLASNHPTAFVDPFMLGVFLDPPCYNMTRGDIFKKPFYRKLMESLNMFPVFRARDGYRGRDRNMEVFEFCENQLVKNRAVTIYVEGEHHLEKRIRPIQKGILRIAFGTYEKHQLDELQIIPAGNNYAYGDRPRDEAMLIMGQPIFIRDYWEAYQKDPAPTMLELAKAIEAQLKSICLHIDKAEDGKLLEQLLTLRRSENPYSLVPIIEYHNRRFEMEKAVCEHLNSLDDSAKSSLQDNVNGYFKELKKAGLTDEGLMQPGQSSWKYWLLFIAGFLPFLAGYISSYPIIWFSKYVAGKTVKKREFYSSVRMGVGLIGALILYLLIFIICLVTLNPWWIAFSLILPILGWFSMFYREIWARWLAAWRAKNHPRRQQLLALRNQIDFVSKSS